MEMSISSYYKWTNYNKTIYKKNPNLMDMKTTITKHQAHRHMKNVAVFKFVCVLP